MVKCELCGWEADDNLENHLSEKHFINYRQYYERVIAGGTEEPCYRCGYPRYLLAPHSTEYLPCEACGQGCSKRIFEERKRDTLEMIYDYLGSIGKNKYHQYLLAYDKLDWILGGILQTGLDLLGKRKKQIKLRLDKAIFPDVQFDSGFPKEISDRNLEHVILGIREDIKTQSQERYVKAGIGNKTFLIWLPEIIDFDIRYHSRYSILNPQSSRKSKRLRLKSQSGDYIKIYGKKDRTILRLTDEDGEEIKFSELPKNIQGDLKMIILGTKSLRDRIIEVYKEITLYCDNVYDKVLVLSSFPIPNSKNFKFYFAWTTSELPQNIEENEDPMVIKLSVI